MRKLYNAPFVELEVIELEDVILDSESTTETPDGTRPGYDLESDLFDEP